MTGIDAPTLWQVTYTVAGVAVASAAAGLLCVRLLARRSLATLLFVVAAVVIVSTTAGVGVIAYKMMISVDDRNVVLAVVVIAGLAGFAVALLVGHRVTAASRVLLAAVRNVGNVGYYEPPQAHLPAEFATVSDELATAHEKLAESHTRERALEASRRELVAWVSHDLRTPLAGLRAMAEALEDGVVVNFETVSTYHTQIRREADRLSAMIDDLFELARIHAGALRLSRRLVGLDDLVAEALASTEPLARAKGVRLRGSSVRGLPVLVDADEFGRALRNLVTNAIRHTPFRGHGRGPGRPAPRHGLRQRGGRLRRDPARGAAPGLRRGVPRRDGPHPRPRQQRRARAQHRPRHRGSARGPDRRAEHRAGLPVRDPAAAGPDGPSAHRPDRAARVRSGRLSNPGGPGRLAQRARHWPAGAAGRGRTRSSRRRTWSRPGTRDRG